MGAVRGHGRRVDMAAEGTVTNGTATNGTVTNGMVIKAMATKGTATKGQGHGGARTSPRSALRTIWSADVWKLHTSVVGRTIPYHATPYRADL